MREREAAGALIERMVSAARIPGRAARDDLRRELWTHFDAAGDTPDALQRAVDRFGADALVIESLRRVHRDEYLLLQFVRTVAAIMACGLAALIVEALANVRPYAHAEGWLAPGFARGTAVAAAVVAGLAAAWEACRLPFDWRRAAAAAGAYFGAWLLAARLFDIGAALCLMATVLVALGCLCSRFHARPRDLLLNFGAFAVALYAAHLASSTAFGIGRALAASAALVAVWAVAVFILSWFDHAFASFFGEADPRGA